MAVIQSGVRPRRFPSSGVPSPLETDPPVPEPPQWSQPARTSLRADEAISLSKSLLHAQMTASKQENQGIVFHIQAAALHSSSSSAAIVRLLTTKGCPSDVINDVLVRPHLNNPKSCPIPNRITIGPITFILAPNFRRHSSLASGLLLTRTTETLREAHKCHPR